MKGMSDWLCLQGSVCNKQHAVFVRTPQAVVLAPCTYWILLLLNLLNTRATRIHKPTHTPAKFLSLYPAAVNHGGNGAKKSRIERNKRKREKVG